MPHADGLVVGIDAGTTSLKVLALDVATGRPVAESAAEYPTGSPEPGAHEQDPADWWDAAVSALHTVLAQVDPSSVRAVGMAGQMHSLLLIGDDDEPIAPAMTWAERRVAEQTQRLSADPAFERLAANGVVDAFTAPKLAWFAARHPLRMAQARRLVLAKDFLRFRLTGEWATDETDAAGTLLYDVHRREWAEELWTAVGADVRLAPAVLPSGAIAGAVTSRAATETGLPVGTLVITGAGDVPAVVLGTGVVSPGRLSVNVGTAAQIMGISPRPEGGGGFVFASATGEGFVAMSSVYAAGASIRWAERTLLAGGPIGEAASQAAPGSEGLTYLPFMFGSTVPVKNDAAKAAFVGQDLRHGVPQLARAVVEGVAFGCADAVGAVSEVVGRPEEIRIVGGVTRSVEWCETFAAAVGPEIRVVRAEGGSARGAAALAAIGAGLWSVDDIASAVGSTVLPGAGAEAAVAAYGRYQEACARML
jgi:xylulokinase